MIFEDLRQQFIDNGFTVEDDKFVKNVYDNSNVMIVNGVRQVKMMRFEMDYIGEGCEVGDSDDSDENVFHEFNIMSDGDVVVTICIESYDDFKKMVNIE